MYGQYFHTKFGIALYRNTLKLCSFFTYNNRKGGGRWVDEIGPTELAVTNHSEPIEPPAAKIIKIGEKHVFSKA